MDAKAKDIVNSYTGREEYAVGDITKEIIRRVSTGEYKVEDVFLLCKVLLSFGAGLTPIASFLPAKLLIEMIEFGLAQEVGGRLMEVLATTLDERFKETVMGDAKYQLGDKTKQAVQTLIQMAFDHNKASSSTAKTGEIEEPKMDSTLIRELEDWDRRLGIALDSKTSTGNDSTTKKS